MNIVKKITLIFLLSFGIISSVMAENNLKMNTIGKADAKVTIDLFYAITCGACAMFDKTVLPEIKKNYVDTGLVKINFIEAPYNSEDILFAYGLLHNTKTEDEFLRLLKAFFEDQQKWATSSSPKQIFKTYAQLMGMQATEIEKIENDKNLQRLILEETTNKLKSLGITGTPTLIFTKTGENASKSSEKIVGLTKYNDVKKKIDKLLK